MDMIAERLGLDPVEFRRKNLVRYEDIVSTGEKLADLHYEELLDRAAKSVKWTASDARWLDKNQGSNRNGALRRGKGLALVIKATITPSTSEAVLKLNEDGSLNVLTSSVELGQGAKTVLAQLAAEALQVPLSSVSVSEDRKSTRLNSSH